MLHLFDLFEPRLKGFGPLPLSQKRIHSDLIESYSFGLVRSRRQLRAAHRLFHDLPHSFIVECTSFVQRTPSALIARTFPLFGPTAVDRQETIILKTYG